MPDKPAPNKVLFIHHGSARGGAPLSLLYLLRAFDPAVVTPVVCSAANDAEVVELFARDGFATCMTPLASFTHTTGQGYAYGNPRDWLRLWAWCADYRPGAERLRQLLRDVQPDVVHLNSLVLAPYLPVMRALGIPAVLHVRESVLHGLLGVRKAWLESLLNTYADQVVLICRDNLRALRLAPGKGVVIYEPLDFTKFDFRLSARQARRELDIPAQARVVLFAGGSVPEIKGQWEFLAAMARVLRSEARLLCLMPSFQPEPAAFHWRDWLSPGKRKARATRRFIARSGLAPHCLGFPFRLDIERFIAASDVVCVPHIKPHFSRTVVEAGAQRKPVVAFRIGGVEEVVQPGVTGMLVPVGDVRGLADATLHLLAHPDLCRQLGVGGYRQARETFSADTCARTMEGIYTALTGPGRGG